MIQIDYDELDRLLSNRGISRRQLAAKIEVSPGTLAGSFRRKSKLKIDRVWKIADYLGIKAIQLLQKDSEGNFNSADYERILFGKTEYESMMENEAIHAIGEKLALLNEFGIKHILNYAALLTEVPSFRKSNSCVGETEGTDDKSGEN